MDPRLRALSAVGLASVLVTCSDGSGPAPVATRLSFTTQPPSGVADTALPSPVRVAVLDQNGDVLATAAVTVTLALATNPTGAVLSGTTSVSTADGVATFTQLVLDRVGSGYTLAASAAGLSGATSAAFAVTLSLADTDGDGFSPNAGDCDDGSSSIKPTAADDPDVSFQDANCDGIDGDTAKAVFVSPTGADGAACGTQASPCASVQTGVTRAAAGARTHVYIAQGTYAGAVTLTNGVSLYGKYTATWSRSASAITTLTGAENVDVSGSLQALTVLAAGITAPTTVADLRLVGPNTTARLAGGDGRSTYVIAATDVSPGALTITRNEIIAGNGASGARGADGGNAATLTATPEMTGDSGGPSDEFTAACNSSSRGAGGAAGTNSAIGIQAGGGAGGAGGTMDTDCNPFSLDQTARPGVGGDNAATYQAATYGFAGAAGGTCFNAPTAGGAGRVMNGAGGAGGTSGGLLVAGFWHAKTGQDGDLGADGTGGGGGGGSGGCDDGTDSYGAGGGGGGAGGLRAGPAARGGGGGGGSFGIYLINASPTITQNIITRGSGGDGGDGGIGGRGQSGGPGGPGGIGIGTAPGAPGGAGSHGGHGGGGGGGAGGISAGIYQSSATSSPTMSANTFSGGAPGFGGAAGQSAPTAPAAERDGAPGTAGANGSVISVGVCASTGGC